MLEEIEAFLTRTGMSPTAFGKAAVGDPRLVGDMRRGRELRKRQRERVMQYIEDHTPAAVEAAE